MCIYQKDSFVYKIMWKVMLLIVFGVLSCDHNTNTEEQTVFIKKTGHQYQLYRNGVPFEIKGASGVSFLKELQEAGGNTIRVYDTLHLARVLEEAQQFDLAVIVDIPLPVFSPEGTFYTNEKLVKKTRIELQNLVKKYRHHPALLLWNLGNEINFPMHPKYTDFYNAFNQFIDVIHQTDPQHPVTTTLSRNAMRKRILSIRWQCPKLDLIAINIFGRLNHIKKDLNSISWLWKGPYLIGEWGINGPWETDYTAWSAPIEETSTKKAEHCKQRYITDIANSDQRCLGSLLFYWGQKQERTHTWFSLFSTTGEHSQIVQEMQQLWQGSPIKNHSPEIDYMLLDQRGARDNIIFRPEEQKKALLFYKDVDQDSLKIVWEVFPENWCYDIEKKQYKPPGIEDLIQEQQSGEVTFVTPKKEGAYRLFAHVYDGKGNFATTNTPFYILKSAYE